MCFRRACYGALLGITVLLTACSSPDAISKFTGSAVTTLQQGTPVFEDMNASCLRALQFQQPFNAFHNVELDASSISLCRNSVHLEDIQSISRVLTTYFSTLSELALVGVAPKATADSAKSNANSVQASAITSGTAKTAKKQDTFSLKDCKNATGALADLLAQVATSGLKTRNLSKELAEADSHVATITQALEHIVKDDYLDGLLLDEKSNLDDYYTLIATDRRQDPPPTFSDVIALKAQWTEASTNLDTKRKSAMAYINGLRQIRDGHAAFVKQVQAKKLSVKDLEATLGPYADSLQGLASRIQ